MDSAANAPPPLCSAMKINASRHRVKPSKLVRVAWERHQLFMLNLLHCQFRMVVSSHPSYFYSRRTSLILIHITNSSTLPCRPSTRPIYHHPTSIRPTYYSLIFLHQVHTQTIFLQISRGCLRETNTHILNLIVTRSILHIDP